MTNNKAASHFQEDFMVNVWSSPDFESRCCSGHYVRAFGHDRVILSLRTSVLIVTFALSCEVGWAIGDKSCSSDSDLQAIDALQKKVKSEKLYVSWTKDRCLSYYPEHCDSKVVELAIRELHNGECGGDPVTDRIVDRFRVRKKSKGIEWFNHADGEYHEFSNIHSVGGK